MAFSRIRFYHFRNLEDATLDTSAKDVFLVGENGQGKTNVLEAVYFTCYGSSFRTRRDETLIQHGKDELSVLAVLEAEQREQKLLVKLSGRTKAIEIDGAEIADRKELVSMVPCIVFCHDDIRFVTGPPEMQRWFMNQTLSLIDPGYLGRMRVYMKVLKSRNAAIRAGQYSLLDAFDRQLVAAGAPLVDQRRQINKRFSDQLTELFATVFEGEQELRLEYRSSWREDPAAQLASGRENDLRLGTTTSGPHRDRFIYRFGGSLLTDAGSTGQLRLVSLILRVAQARFVQETSGRLPILLLDDVLLELDPRRRGRFVTALPEYEQAFFTFLPDEQYARFRTDSTLTYRVSAGQLTHEG